MNYCELLLNINKRFCKEAKVRTNNMEVFIIIGKAIEDALNSDDYKALLNNAIHVAALIKLFQPFKDGNHRTALIVFGNILTEKGYSFDYERALEDMNNGNLNVPTIYDENDRVPFPVKWIGYISDSLDDTFEIKKHG